MFNSMIETWIKINVDPAEWCHVRVFLSRDKLNITYMAQLGEVHVESQPRFLLSTCKELNVAIPNSWGSQSQLQRRSKPKTVIWTLSSPSTFDKSQNKAENVKDWRILFESLDRVTYRNLVYKRTSLEIMRNSLW